MRRSKLKGDEPPVSFDELNLTSSLKIAVLAPHPDDFDAIAVTLKKLHGQGNPIFVAVMTSGASGVEDSFCDPPTKENKEQTREQEQLESIRQFGLPESSVSFQHLLEGNDGHPLDNDFNTTIIRNYLKGLVPDVIFLPHCNDTNLAHKACCRMAIKSVKTLNHHTVFFLNADPKTTSIIAEICTGFDQQGADWKARLLRCHQSQQQRNMKTRGYGFDERILNFNRESAEKYKIGSPYAEVFEMLMLN